MLNKTTSSQKVRYRSNDRKNEFFRVLRGRVRAYFKENDISQYGNRELYIKTAFAILFWLASYILIMSDVLSGNIWLLMGGFTLLGFAQIFIAFNVMHDACHNAYSANRRVNKILAYSMNFIGGNSYLFTRMHNAHHAFVNIHGIDVTLETHGFFRFTPHEPWKPKHRFQAIYTPILYAFAMIHWVTVKDFKWFFMEDNIGNSKRIKHSRRELLVLIISKIWYFGATLALPLIFLSAAWHWISIAWVSLHFLPSLCFALLFQVTHVYNGTHYPLPDDEGNIENNYAIHVLETTADFSRLNKFTTWLTGGINIHVIHHLFPTICHVHYIPLTHIIKETAEEFGMQYMENPNFWVALKKHFQMLHHLSKKDASVPQYGPSINYV